LQQVEQYQIRPAFADLKAKTSALKAATDAFVAEPVAEPKLQAVKDAWLAAYTAYQYATAFNLGPAAEDGLRKTLVQEIATFPINAAKVEAYVKAGAVNLNDFNRDARGFLGVEYLLAKDPNTSQMVASFTDPNRRAVLVQMVNDIDRRVGAVVAAWEGGYATAFTTNTGTEIGSSTSDLYNAFVISFEAAKNYKVALPAGLRVGQTAAEPLLVEANYTGQSLPLLRAHLQGLENVWRGVSRQGDTLLGFRHYLQTVEGGPALIAATETQMAAYKTALEAMPANKTLAEAVVQDPEAVARLSTELQKMTRFYKSDMSSLMGIAITFASGDGD
jgi:hypothetical protein